MPQWQSLGLRPGSVVTRYPKVLAATPSMFGFSLLENQIKDPLLSSSGG